jgi:hypothetical protein
MCALSPRIHDLVFYWRFCAGGDGLYTPTDLGHLFNPPYDAGVRIHSNSWGCDAIVAFVFAFGFVFFAHYPICHARLCNSCVTDDTGGQSCNNYESQAQEIDRSGFVHYCFSRFHKLVPGLLQPSRIFWLWSPRETMVLDLQTRR